MPRTKEEELQWESHRDELRSLWLDQRWTAPQIQGHMSHSHGFSRSLPQYTRQFQKWGFKKNSSDKTWKFVANRLEKRKREGKDPGHVWRDGKLIPDAKVRKEISRHVPLLSQYWDSGEADPQTPAGLVVGTPRSEIDGAPPHDLANFMEIDWCQGLDLDFVNLGASTMFQSPQGDRVQYPIELPGLDIAGFYSQANEELPTASFDPSNSRSESSQPVSQTSASGSSYSQVAPDSIISDIVSETQLSLSGQTHSSGGETHSDLLSRLGPVTIGDVDSELTRRAEAIFQAPNMENLVQYLNLCIYLSSNNMMSQLSTDSLVRLIAKSNSYWSLKSLIKSTTTTIEIFMSNLLASAAALGDTEICRLLIEAGADLDAPSGQMVRTTALRRALVCGQRQCVSMLLEAGADPNLMVDGETPLHIACSKRDALDMVCLLLQFGAHINPLQNSARLTPLQIAVERDDLELVRLLLEQKANPNAFTTSKEGTALQIACANSRNASVVELLLGADADINTRPGYKRDKKIPHYFTDSDDEYSSEDNMEDDCTELLTSLKPAILIAAENDNWEVVQLLLEEGAAVNASLGKLPIDVLEEEVGDYGDTPAVFTPLQAAVRAKNITMTRMLLTAGAQIDARPRGGHGHTELQISAMVGNDRLIEILLRKGADINAPAGIYRGRTALQAAARHSDTKTLAIMLREGADVNGHPARRKGRTALQIAVTAGNTEGVKMLLDAGAAVNSDPSLTEGVTALQQAIRIKDLLIRDEIIHLLLRAGASTEVVESQDYHAPLHVAVESGDEKITERLLKRGGSANLGYCARTSLTPLQKASSEGREGLVRLLLDDGADVNYPAHASRGRTALQAAAERSHVSVVKVLLTYGAKITLEAAKYDGVSAIEAAALQCSQELVELFLAKEPDVVSSDPISKRRIIGLALNSWRCDLSMLELLLDGGADVNGWSSSPFEKSFLQTAVEVGNYRIVQCLVSAGANVNHRWKRDSAANDNGGKTALQMAVSQNSRTMVELLVHHGAKINGLPSPRQGRTALQEAASSGFLELTEYLLAHGAHPNIPAAHFGGVTALQGAAIHGNIRIVMMLLQAGADIDGAPAIDQGRNAISGAAENGRLDTLHLLLNYHPNTEEFQIRKKQAAKLALANGHLAIGRFLLAYRKHSSNI
ncbi:ankyrin repeat-containing domain protein [Aspergillus pseudoustus]|uniref:Ankyrin repeat-containing domain protein n=1 Tax=Aspergillus pseudoustus TaxID=1810923 RepID=A0ABR4KD70_9EURO